MLFFQQKNSEIIKSKNNHTKTTYLEILQSTYYIKLKKVRKFYLLQIFSMFSIEYSYTIVIVI